MKLPELIFYKDNWLIIKGYINPKIREEIKKIPDWYFDPDEETFYFELTPAAIRPIRDLITIYGLEYSDKAWWAITQMQNKYIEKNNQNENPAL